MHALEPDPDDKNQVGPHQRNKPACVGRIEELRTRLDLPILVIVPDRRYLTPQAVIAVVSW